MSILAWDCNKNAPVLAIESPFFWGYHFHILDSYSYTVVPTIFETDLP